jgi:hypothetical protein
LNQYTLVYFINSANGWSGKSLIGCFVSSGFYKKEMNKNGVIYISVGSELKAVA